MVSFEVRISIVPMSPIVLKIFSKILIFLRKFVTVYAFSNLHDSKYIKRFYYNRESMNPPREYYRVTFFVFPL